MSNQTAIETIAHAKKVHRCCWCAEKILIGQSYLRWRFFDGGDAATNKMHPECNSALSRWSIENIGGEWHKGAFTRGCTCESGSCPEPTICKTLNDSP